MPYNITYSKNLDSLSDLATATPDDCSTPISFSFNNYTGLSFYGSGNNDYDTVYRLFSLNGYDYNITFTLGVGDLVGITLTTDDPNATVNNLSYSGI